MKLHLPLLLPAFISLPLLLRAAEPSVTGDKSAPAEINSLWFTAPASVRKPKPGKPLIEESGTRSNLAKSARLINYLDPRRTDVDDSRSKRRHSCCARSQAKRDGAEATLSIVARAFVGTKTSARSSHAAGAIARAQGG